MLAVAAAVALPLGQQPASGASTPGDPRPASTPAAAEPAPAGEPTPAPDSTAGPQPGAPPGVPAGAWDRLLTGSGDAAADSPEVSGISPDSAPANGTGASLRWRTCASATLRFAAARCAMLLVPLDHADPTGPKIRLAVARVRHTVARRNYRGVMLVNPGGPGARGLNFAALGTLLPARVANAYDWIGFDPRGVGRSRPALRCDPSFFGFDRPSYIPRRRPDRTAWLSRSRSYARACAANGAILRHLHTEDVARDMDVLRAALGAETINYYGFSYGTYLGQVYATLFPNRVGRMVLDSNVDPRTVFYRANLQQNLGIDRSMRLWFRWIADNHATYGLGRRRNAVMQTFARIRRTLDQRAAGGRIGGSEWIDIFAPVAYSRDLWPRSARLFAGYVNQRRARLLVRAYRNLGGASRDNPYAVYLAVQCTDAPWPKPWSVWAQDNWRVYRSAPLTTWMNAWLNAPCRTWPAPAGRRFRVNGASLPATLLVGGTLDGPTPFPNSLAVRRSAPRARLVAIVGEATHAASTEVPCTRRRITAYLLRGDLPQRRRGNRADAVCRAPAPPTP